MPRIIEYVSDAGNILIETQSDGGSGAPPTTQIATVDKNFTDLLNMVEPITEAIVTSIGNVSESG